jgi:hypothetical protein
LMFASRSPVTGYWLTITHHQWPINPPRRRRLAAPPEVSKLSPVILPCVSGESRMTLPLLHHQCGLRKRPASGPPIARHYGGPGAELPWKSSCRAWAREGSCHLRRFPVPVWLREPRWPRVWPQVRSERATPGRCAERAHPTSNGPTALGLVLIAHRISALNITGQFLSLFLIFSLQWGDMLMYFVLVMRRTV